MLWIGALLASLLGLDRLFQADREDGSLDLLVIRDAGHFCRSPCSIKCLAHWTASVLPLVVAAPCRAVLDMAPAASPPPCSRCWSARRR